MVGLLFVYCLSIGPVWKLRDKTNRLYGWGDMVDYAYFPIFICMLNYGDTPPGRFFLRYVYDVWKCRPPLLKGLG